MASVEQICPEIVRTRAIALTAADPSVAPSVGTPYSLLLDVSKAVALGGLRLPLVITIGAPNASESTVRAARAIVPSSVTFTPRSVGVYVISVRELFGHHFWGGIRVEVG
jgi:hypothetical protein